MHEAIVVINMVMMMTDMNFLDDMIMITMMDDCFMEVVGCGGHRVRVHAVAFGIAAVRHERNSVGMGWRIDNKLTNRTSGPGHMLMFVMRDSADDRGHVAAIMICTTVA